jgi:alkylhydroperoxidase/carboxymuconolactone decarboxylase family protein YurZ
MATEQELLQGLTAQMEAARGASWEPWPFHRVMAKWDEDFFRVYNERYEQCILTDRPGGLDLKMREIVIVAMCVALQEMTGVRQHGRRALEVGVPLAQLLDVMAIGGHIRGQPCMRDSMAIIAEESGYLAKKATDTGRA